MRTFFQPKARYAATMVVKELEAFSSAEVVVTLRRRSADYRHADFLWGFILSQAALVAMLYLPQRFAIGLFAVHCTLWFLAGTLLSSRIAGMQRMLVGKKRQRAAALQMAQASFMELGVDETRRRSGMLIFLSAYEREAVLVLDRGIPHALTAIWDKAEADVRAAFARADLEGVLAAMRTLGPPLATALPRRSDDINELPDEVQVA